tara:strand:- start:25895 stop:26584 length:690 start_codon:yes stop_codon:yes gene_type:complete
MAIGQNKNNRGAHAQGATRQSGAHSQGSNRIQGARGVHGARTRTSGSGSDTTSSKGNVVHNDQAQVEVDFVEEEDLPVVQWVHPWKVTTNGDDTPATVAVAPGHVLWIATADESSALQSYYNLDIALTYAGGDVTVTGTGYIYAKGDMAVDELLSEGPLTDETILLQNVGATATPITLHFDTVLPVSGAGNFHMRIAKVSLTGTPSVAVVDAQYITHNPNLSVSALAVI